MLHWRSLTLSGTDPETRSIHQAARVKGWRDCSERELNVHKIYTHLRPEAVLVLGLDKGDTDVAARRRLKLDSYVHGVYQRLQLSDADTLSFIGYKEPLFGDYRAASQLGVWEYREMLVKNLQYIELAEDYAGISLLRDPIDWRGVKHCVPHLWRIAVDPEIDNRDPGIDAFSKDASREPLPGLRRPSSVRRMMTAIFARAAKFGNFSAP